GEETRQVQMVCLDDLVPADDDLRRIEALVDWGHVRETARPFYRAGGAGRHGIDPAVLVRLALVLAWRGLPSMRETLRVAATDVSIRRFLGFGLTERLPDHSTFSHAQTKRFAGSSVFEHLFAGHSVSELTADAGYASQDSYCALDRLNTAALIPPQPGAKHPAAVAARERMRTPNGRDAAVDRQAHAEGAIAELKRHGAGRAR